MSQIERIYWIDHQIRANRYPNADDVCAKFEVSRRTAYADRGHLIERLNAPVRFDRAHSGWSYTDPAYVLPFLAISEKQANALGRALLTAREYGGETDAEALTLIAERIGEHASPVRADTWRSAGGSAQTAADISVSAELLDACETALKDRRKLHLLYFSAHRNETDERTVLPYHIHNYQGAWHLIAYCEWRKDLRQFYLGRVRDWKLLPNAGAYTIEESFDAAQYLSQGFAVRHGEELVNVKLLFSAPQSRWIRERIFHPSQQTRELENGRLELTMQVAGTVEVLRWVLGYGPEAEVLEPEELRQQVIKALKASIEIYCTD